MTVAFNTMPGSNRVPGTYAEVNPGISPYSGTSRTLVLGKMTAAGTAAVGVPVLIGSQDPNLLFGPGSMLAAQVVFIRNFNTSGQIWAMPVADPTGSPAKATGTIAITGTATTSGTLTRYINGERYDCAVNSGDTAAVIASNLAALINAGYTKYNVQMLPECVAAAASGTVTLTATFVGVEGNFGTIMAGLDGNEVDPQGLTITLTPFANGTGVTNLATVLSLIGSKQFDWFTGPYNSSAQIGAATQFLMDSGSGRWAPTVALDGHYITALTGNLSALTAFGVTENDRHSTVLGLNSYGSTVWTYAAALAGVVGFSKDFSRALSEAIEIARPLQTITLPGLRGPGPGNPTKLWQYSDLQALYASGISALKFAPDGTPVINRVLTLYQLDVSGIADTTFLGIESIAIACYAKRYLVQQVQKTYPRHVLRDDNPNGIQGIATPAGVKACIVHAYNDLYNTAGIVQSPDLFAQYLIVERSSDPNRLNSYAPVAMANQLITTAINATMFQALNATNASQL